MDKKRILIFIAVASAIFAPAYIYLGWRLAPGPLWWMALAIPFVCVLILPLTFGFSGAERAKANEWISLIAYACMPVLSYLFTWTVLRDLIMLAVLVSEKWDWFHGQAPSPVTTTSLKNDSIWMVLIGTALSVAYGYWKAVRGPSIRQVEVRLPGLPKELDGVVIAQISDLHVGPMIKRPYVENVVRKVNSLDADLIALTGDMGDGDTTELANDFAPLKEMKAKNGIYYVLGNHEYYWNANQWQKAMEGIGAQTLKNRGVRVDVRGCPIFIAGITDAAALQVHQPPGPDWEAVVENMRDERFKLFLKHRPGLPEKAEALGFDLQLSGHTHGGQFFPWTVVVGFVHRHAVGLHKIGRMFLYVNPGTGSWGPLSRLGTTPEVTKLVLRA